MLLHVFVILVFLLNAKCFCEDLMNNSMTYFKTQLVEKCAPDKITNQSRARFSGVLLTRQDSAENEKMTTEKDKTVPLTKELFFNQEEFKEFEKQLADLSITLPLNACDFLKHPKIFSAVSVLPQMTNAKEKEDELTIKDYFNKIEIAYSRKYYISTLLSQMESFPSIEKESIEKKRALSSTDFYLKGLVACLEINCPMNIKKLIIDRIPKMTSYKVYGKDIAQIFLDDNNLSTYFKIDNQFLVGSDITKNNSIAMKTAMKHFPSKSLIEYLQFVSTYHSQVFAVINPKDWVEIIRSKSHFDEVDPNKSELTSDKFVSKNVIGFASPYMGLENYISESSEATKEDKKNLELIFKTYKGGLIHFAEPNWKSIRIPGESNESINNTRIESSTDFYNIYGSVNSKDGNWFLMKDSMKKEYWINQSQFFYSVSISSILASSTLSDDATLYESPGGTKIKSSSSNLFYRGFTSKSFQWIKDQLWIMIDTAKDNPCESEEPNDKTKSKKPLTNVWMKAFKDDGSYNFLHSSGGC